MVHMLAALASDAEQMPAFLQALQSELSLPEGDPTAETWGIGYYADDRALFIKKPADLLAERKLSALSKSLQTRTVVACVASTRSREAAPPHRFRRWLLGHTGDLGGLVLLKERIFDRLPDFVRTELGEGGPGALALGMLMAELHREAALDDPLVDTQTLGRIFARTMSTLRSLLKETEARELRASFVATNGRILLAARSGEPLYLKQQRGLEVPPGAAIDPNLTDFKRLVEALKRFRGLALARHAPEAGGQWKAIDESACLVLDGQLNAHSIPIGSP